MPANNDSYVLIATSLPFLPCSLYPGCRVKAEKRRVPWHLPALRQAGSIQKFVDNVVCLLCYSAGSSPNLILSACVIGRPLSIGMVIVPLSVQSSTVPGVLCSSSLFAGSSGAQEVMFVRQVRRIQVRV